MMIFQMIFWKIMIFYMIFSLACPEEEFNDLCKHHAAKYIKTLKEVNIAFLPYEGQVRPPNTLLIPSNTFLIPSNTFLTLCCPNCFFFRSFLGHA